MNAEIFLKMAVWRQIQNFLSSSCCQIPCPPGLLTDIDGCKCTVVQFEPSKHVLCAFHKQYQRCPQHRIFQWTEIREFAVINDNFTISPIQKKLDHFIWIDLVENTDLWQLTLFVTKGQDT